MVLVIRHELIIIRILFHSSLMTTHLCALQGRIYLDLLQEKFFIERKQKQKLKQLIFGYGFLSPTEKNSHEKRVSRFSEN